MIDVFTRSIASGIPYDIVQRFRRGESLNQVQRTAARRRQDVEQTHLCSTQRTCRVKINNFQGQLRVRKIMRGIRVHLTESGKRSSGSLSSSATINHDSTRSSSHTAISAMGIIR